MNDEQRRMACRFWAVRRHASLMCNKHTTLSLPCPAQNRPPSPGWFIHRQALSCLACPLVRQNL